MYSLNNVTYKDILRIDRLDINRGELTAVIGESGGGKSTLLRLLNRILSHDGGVILYKGSDITAVDPVRLRREAVMMPQNAPQEGANIGEALKRAFAYSEKPYCGDGRALQILSVLGLDKGLDTPLVNLSGGEWQRVALCRALLLDSEILLLDEPTSALDEESAVRVMEYLASLKGAKTIVMVSHADSLVRRYADCLVTVHGGRIAEVLRDE